MTIAEKLYQQGFIRYPRTETNIFSPDVNLVSLVEQHVPDPNYGAFATKVLGWGPSPRRGRKSDQAHPPIHPTKYTNGLSGYESIDLPLAKPQLRANLEKDLQRICDGQKQPQDVLREQIRIHKEAFEKILARSTTIDATLANRLQETPVDSPEPQPTTQFHEVHKCPRCSSMIALKTVQDSRIMLTCLGFPACKQSMWLSQEFFREAVVTEDICENCGPGFKKIKLKLKGMHLASFLNANNVEGLSYVTCPACDRSLKELCGQDNDRQNNVNSTIRPGNNTTTVADSSGNNGYINPNTRNYGGGQNVSRTSANQSTSSNGNVGNNRPNNPRNQGSGSNNSRPPSNNNDTEVKCPKCGKVLSPITSNTASNPGRKFYKCCDNYFKWADEIAIPTSSTRTAQVTAGGNANRTNNAAANRQPPSNASGGAVCATCGNPAKLLQVTRNTPNKGKYFYNCLPECNFFQWADDGIATGNGPSSSGASTSGARSSRNSNDASRPRAKRKCGLCGQEGHIRTKCPNNNN